MKLIDEVEKFYDRVFGNNDGKFNIKDLPNGAPAIVAGVVDVVMLVAEYRVFSAGLTLTHNPFLAIGFLAVSSIPFYLGQIAFLYNQANWMQKIISVLLVLMGLVVSGYFGFSDLLLGTVVNTGVATINPVDPSTLYGVAIAGTILLILGGLSFGLVDDTIAMNLKASRIKARANVAKAEMKIKADLLSEMRQLRIDENKLRGDYQEDYDHVDSQFHKDGKSKVWKDVGLEDNSSRPNRSQRPNLDDQIQKTPQISRTEKPNVSSQIPFFGNATKDTESLSIVKENSDKVKDTAIVPQGTPQRRERSSVFDDVAVRPAPKNLGDSGGDALPH